MRDPKTNGFPSKMNHIWIIAGLSGYFGQSYFWDKPILNHQHILAFHGSSCISSDQCWCQPLWRKLPRRLCALQKCFFPTFLGVSSRLTSKPWNKGKFTKTVWTSAALTFWSSYKWYQFLVGFPHPGKDWSLIGILTSLYNHSHGAEDSCQRSWSGL